MLRNDIHWIDLGIVENSSRQGGVRPCIVLSNNLACKYSPVILVSPITSKLSKKRLPTHVMIGQESGLNKDSVVLLEQVITVDKEKVGDYIGTVPRNKIYEIDRALMISGGIDTQKQITNVIDRDRLDNLISLIKDTEKKISWTDDEYFKKVKRGLLNELKNYCVSCGANYSNIIESNKIELETTSYDRIRLAR